MKQKIQRFLAILIAALWVTTVYAIDAPETLCIKGWKVNDSGWGLIDQNEKVTLDNGVAFHFNVSLSEGNIFKFQPKAGGGEYCSGIGNGLNKASTIETRYDMELTSNDTGAWQLDRGGDVSITCYFPTSGDKASVYVKTGSNNWWTPDGTTIEPAEVPNDLYIIGTVNGGTWDVSNPGSVKGVKNGNVFTFTNIKLNKQTWGASFVFQTEPARTQNHPKAEEIYGCDKSSDVNFDNIVNTDNSLKVVKQTGYKNGTDGGHGWNTTSKFGPFDITVTFAEDGTAQLKIKDHQETVETPEHLYMIGNVMVGDVAQNWNTSNSSLAGVKDGNNFVFSNVELVASDDNNSYFRFADTNNSIGGDGVKSWTPNNQSNADAVSGENTMYDVTGSTDGKWKLAPGNYDITVHFEAGKTYFTYVKKAEPGSVPDELYIRGHVNGSEWNKNFKGEKTNDYTFLFEGVSMTGWTNSSVSTFRFHKDPTGDGTGNGLAYGTADPNDLAVQYDGAHNALTTYDATNKYGWKINNGEYDITVHFDDPENPYFTIATARQPYYFVGDMNNWFSSEFTTNNDKFENTTNYYTKNADGSYSYTPGTGSWNLIVRVFDMKDDMPSWKFRFIGPLDYTATDANGNVETGENWYKFDRFPDGIMNGQFKINDGAGVWTGHSWGNAKSVGGDNNKKEWDDFKAYYYNSFSEKDIKNGTVYGSTMMVKDGGQNLLMQCGGVANAAVYFTPDDGGKIIVKGEPINYYIFYGLKHEEGMDQKNGEDWIRAQINADKPNVNNYYLPGVWYGDKFNDSWAFDDKKSILDPTKAYASGQAASLPYYDANGNRAEHMNIRDRQLSDGTTEPGGIDLVKVDLTKTGTELENELKKVINAEYSTGESVWTGEQIIKGIVDNKKLPDGRDVSEYDYIYIQRIPAGFESPAGKSYTMMFNKKNNHYAGGTYIVRPEHKYFFNGEPVHVHVDFSDVAIWFDVKVSYRIFAYDAQNKTIVVNADESGSENHKVIYNQNQMPKPTQDEDGDAKNFGWVALEDKGECTAWHGNAHDDHEASKDGYKWNYRDVTAGKSGSQMRAEAADSRFAVNDKYGKGFVQLKVEYTKKPGVDYTGTDWDGTVQQAVFYTPSALNPEIADTRLQLDLKDKFIVMEANDPIMTGIEGITIEDVDMEEVENTAAPVYYNLQGVRVAKPTKGIFIEVRGSESKKVLFE